MLHQRQLRLLLRLRRGDELVQLEARGLHLARQLQRLRLHLRCGGVESGRAYVQAYHALVLPAIYPLRACHLSPPCLRSPAAGRRGGRGARVAEQRAAQQQHLGARLQAESGSVSV